MLVLQLLAACQGSPVTASSKVGCRACGRGILWALTPEGKKMPLDAETPVFQVSKDAGPLESGGDRWTAKRLIGAYVSHFSTCKRADAFTNGKDVLKDVERMVRAAAGAKSRGDMPGLTDQLMKLLAVFESPVALP